MTNQIEVTNQDLAITFLITEVVCMIFCAIFINIKEICLVSFISGFMFFTLFLIFFWRSKK